MSTTRDARIANQAGSEVSFGARDPRGSASKALLLGHAGIRDDPVDVEFGNNLNRLLDLCGGLPLLLAVVGRRLAEEDSGDIMGVRVRNQARELEIESRRLELLRESVPNNFPASLQAAVMLSVQFLHRKLDQGRRDLQSIYTVEQMFQSLSVLSNQGWIPISVLSRLWKTDATVYIEHFNRLHLVTRMSRSWKNHGTNAEHEEDGVMLHDLTLDICRLEARSHPLLSDSGDAMSWHEVLLNRYFEGDLSVSEQAAVHTQTLEGDLCQAELLHWYLETENRPATEGSFEQVARTFLREAPRPWWSDSIAEDGYIHANLSRHLGCAGRDSELAALLLEGRWTALRVRIGGILALKTDFDVLENMFVQKERSGGQDPVTEAVRRSLKEIFKAVQLSWLRLGSGPRAFQFQVCGRLASSRKSNGIVEVYLQSVEKCTPRPFLLPISSFFPDLGSALITEIRTGGNCESVACSPCGQYIAAGSGPEVVVASESSGAILRRMRGHTKDVCCVAFVAGSKKLVFGSRNGTIAVWEWESSESPVQIFTGRRSFVSAFTVKTDGDQIVSCSEDGSLKIWDTSTGMQTDEVRHCGSVSCVAVCGETGMIALGLYDGTFKVLDRVTKEVLFEDVDERRKIIEFVMFSPNGLYLAKREDGQPIQLWDTRTWTTTEEGFKGQNSRVRGMAFSPDGDHVASWSDVTIRLCDVKSGKCVETRAEKEPYMRSVSFTADGKRLVSGSEDGIVRIYDARLGAESKKIIYGHSDGVCGVAISPNGHRVASASMDSTVRLWDVQTGEQIGVPLKGHTESVQCVVFSPDGHRVASGSSDCTVRLWDAQTGEQIGVPLKGHTKSVQCVVFSPDGRRVVSVPRFGALRLWDTETQTQIGDPFEGHAPIGSVFCVSFSCDGLRIFSGYYSGAVRIWNAETQKSIGELLQLPRYSGACVSESSDGCHILARHRTGRRIIWNRENRAIVWKSKIDESDSADYITDEEAQKIIRSCGQQTPCHSFPPYTGDMYVKRACVYSNLPAEKTLIADGLTHSHWTYHTEQRIFAAGLRSGAVAICKFVTE